MKQEYALPVDERRERGDEERLALSVGRRRRKGVELSCVAESGRQGVSGGSEEEVGVYVGRKRAEKERT